MHYLFCTGNFRKKQLLIAVKELPSCPLSALETLGKETLKHPKEVSLIPSSALVKSLSLLR
jgi:hypothetical protein